MWDMGALQNLRHLNFEAAGAVPHAWQKAYLNPSYSPAPPSSPPPPPHDKSRLPACVAVIKYDTPVICPRELTASANINQAELQSMIKEAEVKIWASRIDGWTLGQAALQFC